ncbi:MAG: lipopolysaccharide core heptose(I) kinase RfaP [Verrucomicrobiae bacterium]|nr:lipopolysaccharide core heptose(I) kinase RfaP [Verrucomicrobiae bacterium]NNJ43717.1 lipopolysaccharide core heptose(I) kinase RfaP [Akkermansiaceae bacterium]
MIKLADEIRGKFSDVLSSDGAFDEVLVLEGEIYRAKEGRRTLRFEYGGENYFAKIHMGIGWKEVFKNLTAFRLPITDASNEWMAVEVLEHVGVDTVKIVGKGSRGWNPAKRESFVVMKALDELVEVEDFLKELGGLQGRRRLELKRVIVRKVAESARRMHAAGMNHRDFYLCHFHILERDWSDWSPEEDFRLPLIDLHRSQIRSHVPMRWLAKDLGALLYSAIDCGMTDRDLVAFLRVYLGREWKQRLSDESTLWQMVVKRAGGFYQRHRGRKMPLPGVFQRFEY